MVRRTHTGILTPIDGHRRSFSWTILMVWMGISWNIHSQSEGSEPAPYESQQEELNRYLKRRPNHRLAKNIILFIGDGMGISTLTASRILEGQQNGAREELGT